MGTMTASGNGAAGHSASRPTLLVDRDQRPEGTLVDISGVRIGGREIVMIAGPCAVESQRQILETARAVKSCGARMLRGGAFKPRTNPYSFRGLEVAGLELLAQARKETGLPIVTEVMDTRKVDVVCRYADMLQVGSRNMHNYALLEAVGDATTPVMLKRGIDATVQEFLDAAQHVLRQGNQNVVLCERGIRTFETATRNTLDLSAIPMLKHHTHLPVVVDPSHGTGHWWMVPWMAKAAVAAGADGLMVEVHVRPDDALSDGAQSLRPGLFRTMMKELRAIAEVVGRVISSPNVRHETNAMARERERPSSAVIL